MLFQNDPRRDLDSWFSRPPSRGSDRMMAMDAYRRGGAVWVHLDLPGVATDSIHIDVERNVLTVSCERTWDTDEGDQIYISERTQGDYRRQVHLGDGLDPDGIAADLRDGVLTLRIPVAARSEPRRIDVTSSGTSTAIDT